MHSQNFILYTKHIEKRHEPKNAIITLSACGLEKKASQNLFISLWGRDLGYDRMRSAEKKSECARDEVFEKFGRSNKNTPSYE